jgi:adenosylcobinamide kinase / adenosylcobinamide-phosphate guanylyltransferase
VITLLLGGAASGKSAAAEQLAAALPPPVTYIATWVRSPDDADMEARVAAHRARRPPSWGLVEAAGADLVPVLGATEGTVLVDTLGTWVAGCPAFAAPCGDLCRALVSRAGDTVVVSDEVGLGVHPSSAAGREFRDALGAVNQAVAAVADDVWLVVAGRLLALERP